MAGLLTSLFGPATAVDPLGGFMGSQYYDPNEARAQATSDALKAASYALLNPRQGGGSGWARAIGDIGGAMGAAGTGYKQGKSSYLQEGMSKKMAADEMRRKQYLEDKKREEDAALVSAVEGLSEEERNLILANPETGIALLQDRIFGVPKNVRDDRPALIQEYEYALAHGFKGSLIDYEQAKKGNGITIQNADGSFTQIGGSAKSGTTVEQGKAGALFKRSQPSLATLNDPDVVKSLTTPGTDPILGSLPIPGKNLAISKEYQIGQVAANNILTAILRRESGAQITESEWATYGATFIPVVGDKKETLQYKSMLRQKAIEGIQMGMSPEQILKMGMSGELLSLDINAAKSEDGRSDEELLNAY